jgi:hypothetical protein
MIDFRNFYKVHAPSPSTLLADRGWDVFISAFNSTDRVHAVYTHARARQKFWLVHEEYAFTADAIPIAAIPAAGGAEDTAVRQFIRAADWDPTRGSVCIDLTGFMRPHILFLVSYLARVGVKSFDALYCEPGRYIERHKTPFSIGAASEIRPVRGYGGQHLAKPEPNDLLIIGAGYEHSLITAVAEEMRGARIVQLFGFPPLQPDFYQESFLRSDVAAEAVGEGAHERFFAPAYDPFATAQTLRRIVREHEQRRKLDNLYLSPLATRAQTLGFGLYYLYDREGSATSIRYPFSRSYKQDTTEGVGRVWWYRVELPTRATPVAADVVAGT